MQTSVTRFLEAARVPDTVAPQRFGLWTIERRAEDALLKRAGLFTVGWPTYTLLWRATLGTLHLTQGHGEVVMEDSQRELRRHLPIWLAARGRVLITGLGLGCVVRGLLASPHVDHIDVVENDPGILGTIGLEFASEQRVTLHHADAMEFPIGTQRWDYAWHDLYIEDDAKGLHLLHLELLHRYRRVCPHQGAWMLPRIVKRIWPRRLLG